MDPESDPRNLPGPLGVKYDDELNYLRIHLVVTGIKPKSLTRASNTDVRLKYDSESFSILLEVFKMNKKSKPPKKNYIDRRYYEMAKCPGKITNIEYKLKKDQCILTAYKQTPGLWANVLSL